MQILLRNGFTDKIEVFQGDEAQVNEMAKFYLDAGHDVIYFYASIVGYELEAV